MYSPPTDSTALSAARLLSPHGERKTLRANHSVNPAESKGRNLVAQKFHHVRASEFS
jgi:hypothetical protein